MSQLGYMFMAAGLGGYSLAIFHVFTHAFFKALLFMGAGAVILAMHHEQDITKMGGLGRKMPLLFGMMLIATLALSAVPPFAGFISKDAIMGHLFASGHYAIYLIALATSALTAFYMFRLLFYVFLGSETHETSAVPRSMLIPMGVLALFSVVAGVFNLPALLGGQEQFSHWLGLADLRPHLAHGAEAMLIAANLLLIAGASYLAYLRYGAKDAARSDDNATPFMRAVAGKFYVDEIYAALFVQPLQRFSGWLEVSFNIGVVDRNLQRIAAAYLGLGNRLRVFHNGNIRFYALYMMVGISLFLIYLYRSLGV